ncbi:MAG TPA: hypothetical protein VJI75_05440 [Candidatus Nanoarchaeia archaeon]|nr:hypothetical protein [Candidatus Nanoarchaeia archaeon]
MLDRPGGWSWNNWELWCKLETEDKDKDGYPASDPSAPENNDCADDPSNRQVDNCPVVDGVETSCLCPITPEDIAIDCLKAEYSACAACINPDADESCDGVDNNCDVDGKVDEGCDSDADGYVDNAMLCSGTPKCMKDDGVDSGVSCHPCEQLDCNDDDPAISPGAEEVFDTNDPPVDENCDGTGNNGMEDKDPLACNFPNYEIGEGDSFGCCGDDSFKEFFSATNAACIRSSPAPQFGISKGVVGDISEWIANADAWDRQIAVIDVTILIANIFSFGAADLNFLIKPVDIQAEFEDNTFSSLNSNPIIVKLAPIVEKDKIYAFSFIIEVLESTDAWSVKYDLSDVKTKEIILDSEGVAFEGEILPGQKARRSITFTAPSNQVLITLATEGADPGEHSFIIDDLKFYNQDDLKILHDSGSFYSCDANEISSLKITDKEGVSQIANLFTNDYSYSASCSDRYRKRPTGEEASTDLQDYFCADIGWVGAGVNIENDNPDNPIVEKSVPEGYCSNNICTIADGCCPEDYCWDGVSCILPSTDLGENIPGFKCVNKEGKGEWDVIAEKPDQNGENLESGDCSESTCHYTDDSGQGSCVSDGFFGATEDNYLQAMDQYCDKGEWTTRTNLIALQLLDIAHADMSASNPRYSLFCDAVAHAANKYYAHDALVLDEELAGRVNNLCVLEYSTINNVKKTVTGISFNKPINDEENTFLVFFDESKSFVPDEHYTFCDNVLDQDGAFHKCGSPPTDKMWYNSKTLSLIYSKEAVKVEGGGSFLSGAFTHPVRAVIDLIYKMFNLATEQEETSSFIRGKGMLDKVFINIDGDRAIRASIEKIGAEMMLLAGYENIATDICSAVKASEIGDCFPEIKDDSYSVNVASPTLEDLSDTAYSSLPDLTAKVRFQQAQVEITRDGDAISAVSAALQPESQDYAFTASLTGKPSSLIGYYWDFGDGTSFGTTDPCTSGVLPEAECSDGYQAVTHSYLEAGSFIPTLRVVDRSFSISEKTGSELSVSLPFLQLLE